MEEEKEQKIYHKIEAGKKIRVFKSTFQDRSFYKVQVTQKEYDGTASKYYIDLQFKKGVELADPTGKGIDIIINKAYENMRANPSDKYHPIVYLMITDFEIVQNQEQIEAQAYQEYRDTLDEVSIDDDFLD